MRATSSELSSSPDIPGLKRRQLVEFRTAAWPAIREYLDRFVGENSKIVSLTVRTIDGAYLAKATLEGVPEGQIRAFLRDRADIEGLSVETLFYAASGAPALSL